MPPNPTCPIEGQIFQKCPPCRATCSNPKAKCFTECTPGCGCPAGEVIDTVNNKCVNPKQCPVDCALASSICVHPICAAGGEIIVLPGECCPVCACRVGDKIYPAGEIFKLGCKDCACLKTGQLLCSTQNCDGPHLQ